LYLHVSFILGPEKHLAPVWTLKDQTQTTNDYDEQRFYKCIYATLKLHISSVHVFPGYQTHDLAVVW